MSRLTAKRLKMLKTLKSGPPYTTALYHSHHLMHNSTHLSMYLCSETSEGRLNLGQDQVYARGSGWCVRRRRKLGTAGRTHTNPLGFL